MPGSNIEPWDPPTDFLEYQQYLYGYLSRNLTHVTKDEMSYLIDAIDACFDASWLLENSLRSIFDMVVYGITGQVAYEDEKMTISEAVDFLKCAYIDMDVDSSPDVVARSELSDILANLKTALNNHQPDSSDNYFFMDENESTEAAEIDKAYKIEEIQDDYEEQTWDNEMVEENIRIQEHLIAAENALRSGDIETLETELEILLTETKSNNDIDDEELARWLSVLGHTFYRKQSPIQIRGDSEQQDDYSQERKLVAISIQKLSDALCRLIARNKHILYKIEWRDLERVVATALDGIGFTVELTPPAKDGGKDIIAQCYLHGLKLTFYIEIKHWRSGKRVNFEAIRNFLELNAYDYTDGGVFISTSGYASEVGSHIVEIHRRRVRLGAKSKIVSLCKHYALHREGLWKPETTLPTLLFSDTLDVTSGNN